MLARPADRCMCRSDWPHVPPHEMQTGATLAVPYRGIPYDRLVDDFLCEFGSTALADLLMQDDPARL
jgi:hypothetical protein